MITGNPDNSRNSLPRTLSIVVFTNTILWVLSVIALIFIIQSSPSAKGLFVILAAGLGNALSIISIIRKQWHSRTY